MAIQSNLGIMSVLIATYADQGRDVILAADCLRSEWNISSGCYQPQPGQVHKVQRITDSIGIGIAGIVPFSNTLRELIMATDSQQDDWLGLFRDACPRLREEVRLEIREQYGASLSDEDERRMMNDITVLIGGKIAGRKTIYCWCEESGWEFEARAYKEFPFGVFSSPPDATRQHEEKAKTRLRKPIAAE